VTDFQLGIDHLHLDGITAKSAAALDMDHVGALDLVIQFSNGVGDASERRSRA
jgi:hypothetical protein